MREAGAGTPGIFQLAAVIKSEHQCADGARIRCRWHEARHDEFLPVRAFGLDPVMASAGGVRRLGKLRYNSLKSHLAGVLEQARSRSAQRLAQAQRPRLLPEQGCQRVLSCGQRELPQVGAVKVQKIEDIKNHAVMTAGLEILLQEGKARQAVVAFRHHFPVDERSRCRQLRDRGGDGWKFCRPVEALTSEKFDLAAIKARLNAITVELDLVNPGVAVGRFVARGGETGRHESGEGLFWSRRRIVARRFFPFADRADRGGAHPPAWRRPRRAGALFAFSLRSVAVPYFLRAVRDFLLRGTADP